MNKISVEISVDEGGRAHAELKNLNRELDGFGSGVNKAASSGTSLKTIFAGNVLADFFTRGTSAAASFTAQAIQASAAASDANRTLEFSATQAGLSYTKAAELAEDFGRRVGASNTEAAKTYSSIIQLAAAAGRADDTELIGKRFADLGAARGIKGNELSVLIGTIKSGQDEGLNRLGLDDPSKLEAAYAKEIGKSAEALSMKEKMLARLVAVERLAASAEGEAEKRLQGTAGQLDTAAASYQNLTTQIGETITNSVQFKDTLGFITDALGGVVTSHAEARRELAKGLKTPEQLAKEAGQTDERRLGDSILGGFTTPLAIGATVIDSFKLGLGQINADDFKTRLKGNFNASVDPGARQVEADTERFKGIQREIKEQEEAKGAAASAAAKQRATEAAAEAAALEKVAKQVRTTRDAARSFLDDVAQRADSDNPFTKLFTDGLSSLEKIKTQFAPFGDAFVDEMTRMQLGVLDTERALLSLNSKLAATKLNQEARRLELGANVGLTGPEDRQIDILKAQLNQATAGTSALASAESIRGGFTRAPADLARSQAEEIERLKRSQAEASRIGFADPSRAARQAEEIEELKRRQSLATVANSGGVDPAYLAGQQFAALEKLQRRTLDQPDGNAKNAAQELIANQLTQLFSGLDERTRAKLDAPTRERFAGAFDTSAKAAARGVEEAIERQKVGDLIQTDARELVKQVNASDLTRAAKNKELLAVAGSLSERELTPELRTARVKALREGAINEAAKEEQAAERAKKQDALFGLIDAALKGAGIKVDLGSQKALVEITTTGGAKASTLGEAF
ncbi:MAG: hypothetical protein M3458_05325 [Acidobacteriota bacterium]|nr:hypothetical protein [Acidobacteriota bacterium]